MNPREVKLTFSEYVKSRLLHKDGRFRKDDQYVFYLLWQKEMGQLAAGVCNFLKGTRQHAMPVGEFMDRVSNSDEHIEGSLSTVFHNIRGSNQFWYLRRSEVLCMVREYGPPTLCLTLSCAEYNSLEIATYLRKVNDVSDSYPIGKLCTEVRRENVLRNITTSSGLLSSTERNWVVLLTTFAKKSTRPGEHHTTTSSCG